MSNSVPFSMNECCGCGVCSYVCPKHAIIIREDSEGFPSPVVNKELCNNCGLCQKNCAFFSRTNYYHSFESKVYVAKHKNQDIRMNSRSGAVFVSCSDWVLSQGGSVYGCVMFDKYKATHVRTITKDGRDEMCKSKYIQSRTENVWPQVEEDLEKGLIVLFTGTGCQVDALYSYLNFQKISTDRLYTMDLICHGVPSPLLFREYIKWTEKRYNGEIDRFEFRDKTACGWDGHMESFYIKGEKHLCSRWRDIYYSNCISRLSCSNCHYASVHRVGDLTFADAWGIKESFDSFNDNRGVSVVLVNSPKGNELMKTIADSCYIHEMHLQQMMQPNLQKPSVPKVDRDTLWRVFRKDGFDGLVRIYATPTLLKLTKRKVKYILRKIILGHKYYLP